MDDLYFAIDPEGLLKVGRTKRVEERMTQLKATLLKRIDGRGDLEDFFLECLREYNIRGERFIMPRGGLDEVFHLALIKTNFRLAEIRALLSLARMRELSGREIA